MINEWRDSIRLSLFVYAKSISLQRRGNEMETITIKIKDIEMNFEEQVLKIPELSVYENEKIGLIGANGSGKSTLLRLIAGELQASKGTIDTFCDFPLYHQISGVEETVSELDGELLSRFKVPNNSVETLSGGETTKYRLTQLLSVYQTGMLLDEPTTHLDQKGKQQLIDELQYYYGTLLFVSHDRTFLNALAEKIWEVKDGKVVEYKGNYNDYLEQKKIERVSQEREVQNYQKEVTRLTKGIEEKRQKAEKAGKVSEKNKQKNVRPSRLSSSKQKDTVQKNLYKQAKAMSSRLEQLADIQILEKDISIQFPKHSSAEIHNPYPIRIENLTVNYEQRMILDKINLQIPLGKKIALVGENGAGKSTLLNAILKQFEGVILSPKAKIETYRQMDYQFTTVHSLLTELMDETDWSEATVRALLNNLGFSQSAIRKPLNVLSGGEATRIAIARLFTKPSNVLILDEPTNFIDLTTIEALEKFLLAYQGTVLFTSHDQTFVEKVADEVWLLENGKLSLV